jgi:hypothetical protein
MLACFYSSRGCCETMDAAAAAAAADDDDEFWDLRVVLGIG